MARKTLLGSAAVAVMALALSACGGGGGSRAATPAPTPAPAPAPTPTPTTSIDVLPCLSQVLPADLNRAPPGTTILQLVVPDTITIYPDRTITFPNGRLLRDPVVDITLAVILLDMTAPGQNAGTFAATPLNPTSATKPPLPDFPFANTPNGTPPLDAGNGTNFTFDTAPMSAYVQVDRMGMPAVATAIIRSARKNAYSDGNVQLDTANAFAFDLIDGLKFFAQPLQDDLAARGLRTCAK